MSVVGRREELKILEKVRNSNDAELLAVYGRRRVGKTYLISEFFRDTGTYFELTGTKDAKMQEQLINFSSEFSRVFLRGERIPSPANWTEAFLQLKDAIDKLGGDQKVILFFDELPWLASQKSGFLQALEYIWNRHLSRDKRIIVIICGSAASWMITNIVHNKGGLHNRVTKKIRLLPFTLSETEDFLKSRSINLDRKQIAELYMATGGVAQYLKYTQRGQSATQIINNMCFNKDGELFGEFERLYQSLFDDYENHLKIIRALATSSTGLTKNELLDFTGLKSGGSFTKLINELEESNFIASIPTFNRKKTTCKYRLMDEYSLFYLTWIDKLPRSGLESIDKDYWLKLRSSRSWGAWSGYAFENICFRHFTKIKAALGIAGISTIESGWIYISAKNQEEKGAQVDMLIDRADNCINLCEMKYYDAEFLIDRDYANLLKNRKDIFRERTRTKKTLFTTMITIYGVKENEYYLSAVDNQLTIDALFA